MSLIIRTKFLRQGNTVHVVNMTASSQWLTRATLFTAYHGTSLIPERYPILTM